MSTYGPDETPDRRPTVDDELRAALGGATERESFDHEALVAGTLERAGRIRRRRAVSAAVAAAIIVPTLAGTGWILGNRLTGDPQGSVDVMIATQTETPTLAPAPDVVATESPSATDDEESTEEPVEPPVQTAVEPTEPELTTPRPTDEASAPEPETETAAEEPPEDTQPEPTADETAAVDTPPWQDAELLRYPLMGISEEGQPNRIEVPDARPTGIATLDALGIPSQANLTRTITPILGTTTSQALEGVDHHSGYQWIYWDQALGSELVLTLTAWDDSSFALEQLTTGGTELTSQWGFGAGPVIPEPYPYPGYEGDADHFLTIGAISGTTAHGVALVRQGDYLVTASVPDATTEGALARAADLAQKTAENLAYLDPVNGTDR